MLTGQPPFVADSVDEVREQVRSREPDAPSTLNSAVTPALDAFCLRCLQKNPARRFFRVFDVTTRLRTLQ